MLRASAIFLLLTLLPACSAPRPGSELPRRGDEIMVCGRLFHTGAPVVLWTDPGGYDAYRVERRFVPPDKASWHASKDALDSPNRYGTRRLPLTDSERDQVRAGGWSLDALRRHVDQFVIHYDACGTSRRCFQVLHDERGLSIHFMIDLDGTIYQTLDVKERAWHATVANDRSVGVELANIGAYPPADDKTLSTWYHPDASGRTYVTLPSWLGDGGIRTPNFIARPARDAPVEGSIHGAPLRQYDFTPQQYDSLARLAATLHRALPGIKLDYPRGADGRVLTRALTESELASFRGILAHWHVQSNKIDPGPAFDWDRAVAGPRRNTPSGSR